MEPRLAIVFVLAALACGCTIPIPTDGCRSGLFTDEGDCCNYVCEKSCTHGFVEGSCNCECLQITTE
ncbi:MAG: hypothetical protein KJ709_05660, partial [Nanoarchaeota archaeon]|nr:hypothetical protein [Nanoarchaeota archaeon]